MKRLLKHPFVQSILCFIGAIAIRLIFWTSRREWIVHPDTRPYLHGGEQLVLAFWHGRLMMMPYFKPRRRRIHVLISGHKDGVIISKVIRWFGIDTITGSSSKGGSEAFREMLRAAKRGDNLCFTPDGPRGPLQQAVAGVVHAAKHTGLPVVPVTFSATRCKRLKSWDKFMVGLPFGHLCFVAGSPIHVEKRADVALLEKKRLEVEAELNAITEEADRRCAMRGI
jgi:lysophospholipid acyltransferase (LPLAT)-like uncharacterized protein